jgi:hypothetical protein
MDSGSIWAGIIRPANINSQNYTVEFPTTYNDPNNPATALGTFIPGPYTLGNTVYSLGTNPGVGFSTVLEETPAYPIVNDFGYSNLLDPNQYNVGALPATITGTFTGNGITNGPYIQTNCVPGRIQYGTIDVTYGNRLGQSDVQFLANGFKLTSAVSNSGSVSYTVTTSHTDGEYFIRNGGATQVPFAGPTVGWANSNTN